MLVTSICDFIIFFFKVLEIICAIMPPMIITVSNLNQPGVDVFANLTERELRFSYEKMSRASCLYGFKESS